MKLSLIEFKPLVNIQWTERITDSGLLYYTPTDEVSTKLFKLDLLKKIISKKFKNQNAITEIPNFDSSQPVYLFPDLRLKKSRI